MDNRDILNLYEAYVEIYSELDEAKVDDDQNSTMKMVNRNTRNNVGKSSRRSLNKIYRGHTKKSLDIPARDMSPTPHGKTDEGKGRYWTKMIAKQRAAANEEMDIYDIVLAHLLDEGYAETPEAAEKIMVSMSEEWLDEVLDEAKVDWHNRDQSDISDRVKVLRDRNKRNAPGIPDGYQTASRRTKHETSRGKKKTPGLKPTSDNLGKMGRGPYRKQQYKRTGNDLYKD